MSDTQKQRVQKIAGVKGMNDLLPGDAPLWEHFDNAVRSMLRAYGYQQIRTPIVEQTQLFVRGIGEVTDIVEKEMYSFTDALNGEQLTMRPEGTAAAVRAVIEHNLLYDGPKRLWYTGRCSATRNRSAAVIASSTRWAWKRWALPARTSMRKSS